MTDQTEATPPPKAGNHPGQARLIDAHAAVRRARRKFLRYADFRYSQFIDDPGQHPHGMACIHFTNWRECRDHLGYEGLETVNEGIEARLRELLETRDAFLRLNDGQLVGLLWPSDGRRDIEGWAATAIERLTESEFPVGSHWFTARFSIGLCWFDQRVRVAEEALLDAMQMAEQLERDGANNYRLFEPVTAAREDLDSDEQLAASVKRALQSNQLRLVFQPLLAAEAEGGHYYQAWVRLISRSGKLVPARAFLDVARKYELLGPLQRWCLRQSLRYLATGHGAPSALRLFVNASPEAFSPRMLDYLDRIFRRHPEIPPRLIAEFDRFDLANRQRETQRVMARLREYGVRLGVSGVGEEHFSDTVLDDAPVEFIRLAPGMDQRLRDQPQLAGELMGFLSRAHHQQRSVIMPDVDREDQIIQFWQAGVDFIQGEFIERPRTRAPES